MGRMGESQSAAQLAKLLLIADGKLGKTFYAASVARAGFNVLYLDGDVGAATIGSMLQEGQLTKEQANRIYLLDIRDTIMGGVRDTRMIETMNEFASSATFKWNETANRPATHKDVGEIWSIKPALMTNTDVLVIDSWTAYTESLMLWVARANGLDLTTASLSEMRAVYQGGGLKSTEMLQMIRSMPCHVIVLAHPDEYMHMVNPEGAKVANVKEKDKVILWTKMIPKTTSKPQGLQMAKYFSDVAWMEMSPSGTERRLSFKPKADRVSGGHFFDSKSVDEYSFANLVKKVGGTLPEGANEPRWITINHVDTPAVVETKVLDGTNPTEVKSSGMTSIFAKK